jgi:hypothetical protein
MMTHFATSFVRGSGANGGRRPVVAAFARADGGSDDRPDQILRTRPIQFDVEPKRTPSESSSLTDRQNGLSTRFLIKVAPLRRV